MKMELLQVVDPTPAELRVPIVVELTRQSAATWRQSCRHWRDIALAALGDSDLPRVVYALNEAATRNQWAMEDDAMVLKLEASM